MPAKQALICTLLSAIAILLVAFNIKAIVFVIGNVLYLGAGLAMIVGLAVMFGNRKI